MVHLMIDVCVYMMGTVRFALLVFIIPMFHWSWMRIYPQKKFNIMRRNLLLDYRWMIYMGSWLFNKNANNRDLVKIEFDYIVAQILIQFKDINNGAVPRLIIIYAIRAESALVEECNLYTCKANLMPTRFLVFQRNSLKIYFWSRV